MKPSGARPVFTDREYSVYSLLTAGYSNGKIGALLGISERTVKYYAWEIYQKLGVTTRAEAIARARELGDTNI
jgi:DNA-binding NarL/FixJ family response regulator